MVTNLSSPKLILTSQDIGIYRPSMYSLVKILINSKFVLYVYIQYNFRSDSVLQKMFDHEVFWNIQRETCQKGVVDFFCTVKNARKGTRIIQM